ncbi:Serine/threonine-protein kinase rio1 [Psilocybe cubensis]|uniref:Serine/threonine-protein kinase rio1 n=2 Tax=Psilocybe cubensis TaxID=181762 RepID=A0ACB8GXV7_PSICU|nr:Serine/threonine-protein kinase rio1 [Psilocybe cubensis]KAH9480406.1 Serine/threonine-protein kinase rio1 [Psilocybe cubensis]
MTSLTPPIVPGQFDDAEEGNEPTNREGQAYIDTYDPATEAHVLDWPDTEDEDEIDDEDDEYYDNRVEDEDWENAERDFTKQYNRLRQHTAVRTGNAQGVSSAFNRSEAVALLPPVNHPKTSTVSSSNLSSKVAGGTAKDRTNDQLAALAKYNSRLAKIDVPYVMGVGVNRKGPSAHANLKDKSDRATNEQVLDPRTRLILFKMIGRGLIDEVNGCVSTGKEANVYHALTPEKTHLALKIYKTSILVFKDRDKYVTGEFRFRKGYSRNPRKMVRMWAEKEMRNLKRLVAAGIRAPDPVEVRENVLVMTFVGDKDGWASPRMKDASLPPENVGQLYEELVLVVRRMFHVCKLVHADLSEYNIMYHEGHLWIIDVSQSVEHDHPSAFDFLRNDIKNVEDFFGRLGVTCLGLRRCFEFVTKEKLTEEEGVSDEEVLKKLLAERAEDQDAETEDRAGEDGESGFNDVSTSQKTKSEDTAHEDAVFLQSFIPRTLNEVYDPERDVEKYKRGDGLIYADTIGLVSSSDKKEEISGGGIGSNSKPKAPKTSVNDSDAAPISSVRFDAGEGQDVKNQDTVDESSSEDEDDEDEDEDGGENGEKVFVEKKPRGHRHEDKEAKKERKKQVKAEAKEKRKHKMPKAEKKRIVRKTKS